MPKAYLIDMDGVLLTGSVPIPGAPEFIARLRKARVPFMVLTINSRYTPRDHEVRLRTAGLDIAAESIFTSALATARFLHQQRPGGSAFVIGEAGLTTALHEIGYVFTEHSPDYVVVTVAQQAEQETVSRLVVSNLEVLAAGTRSDQEKSRTDGKPIPSTVVTLLATPEDSERIALAQTEGRVMLVLRNPLDMAPVQTPGIRMASLVGPPAPPPVEKKSQGKKVMVAQRLPQPEPVKPYTVEAIRAAKRTEEPIR